MSNSSIINENVSHDIKTIINGIKQDDDILATFMNELVNKYGLDEIQNRIASLSGTDLNEPILNPKNQKFTAFPLKYMKIWKLYKQQEASFWKAEEINFSKDYEDFMTLDDNEKYFIEMILAFFAASDGIVNFNLNERFSREVKITEAQFAYQFQMMMENIHSETYSLMLDNIVKDKERKDFLFNAVQNVPSVKLMADWAFKWINSSKSFAHRLVAFAIVEGIFFSGAFASIFWLKKYKNYGRTFMNGLVMSNKFISRDERLHYEFACELYKLLENKLDRCDVVEILKEAIIISQNFMRDALPIRLIGMNNEMMDDHIEYMGDRLLNMLGHSKYYNKKNPFDFLDTIHLPDKTNFHEKRPHEYQDSYIMNDDRNKELLNLNIDDIDDLDF